MHSDEMELCLERSVREKQEAISRQAQRGIAEPNTTQRHACTLWQSKANSHTLTEQNLASLLQIDLYKSERDSNNSNQSQHFTARETDEKKVEQGFH